MLGVYNKRIVNDINWSEQSNTHEIEEQRYKNPLQIVKLNTTNQVKPSQMLFCRCERINLETRTRKLPNQSIFTRKAHSYAAILTVLCPRVLTKLYIAHNNMLSNLRESHTVVQRFAIWNEKSTSSYKNISILLYKTRVLSWNVFIVKTKRSAHTQQKLDGTFQLS